MTTDVRLMTLEPGHFHAALVHKEMYPGVSPAVHVYAPPGPDLDAHLARVAAFNARPDRPTGWRLVVHAGPDSRDRLLKERPGNVVVLSGRNRDKIGHIHAAVAAGLHVLADKPWIIRAEDRPLLRDALDLASRNGVLASDMMTERYEITSVLQRELMCDAEVFGGPVAGSADDPGVVMASVHYLCKSVAGAPLRRPAWFFDVTQQGEGLADVGTHLVDLALWALFPGRAVAEEEVAVHSARRWPTPLSRADFQKVTGEADFPDFLRPHLSGRHLPYCCNTQVGFTAHGAHVRLDVCWGFEAEAGAGDSHFAVFRGGRSSVGVRQGAEQGFRPELSVVPNRDAERGGVFAALRAKVERLQTAYPGVGVEERGQFAHLTIPNRYRVGHEAHFGQVTRQFLAHLEAPAAVPAWERANLLSKYAVTTEGVRLARATA
jgi:predicted dehydrogenase